MMHSIYLITNQITNKQYIGYTSIDLKDRIIGHISSAKCNSMFILHQSIRKYGWNNFTAEIIYQSENGDHTLKVMEKHFITEYGTFGGGYNMTPGGEGSGPCSPETSAKISAIKKGMALPWAIGNTNTKDHFWATNGVENIHLSPNSPIPGGYQKGRTLGSPNRTKQTIRSKFPGGYKKSTKPRKPRSQEHKDKIALSMIGSARAAGNKNVTGTIWVNDGSINKRVKPGEIPDGFKRGKL